MFQNFMTNQLFGCEFCVVKQDTFYLHQDNDQANFHRKGEEITIGRSLRGKTVTTYLKLAQN